MLVALVRHEEVVVAKLDGLGEVEIWVGEAEGLALVVVVAW